MTTAREKAKEKAQLESELKTLTIARNKAKAELILNRQAIEALEEKRKDLRQELSAAEVRLLDKQVELDRLKPLSPTARKWFAQIIEVGSLIVFTGTRNDNSDGKRIHELHRLGYIDHRYNGPGSQFVTLTPLGVERMKKERKK